MSSTTPDPASRGLRASFESVSSRDSLDLPDYHESHHDQPDSHSAPLLSNDAPTRHRDPDTSILKDAAHPKVQGYWLYALTFAAGLSGLLFGYDTASISSALLYIPASLSTPENPITTFTLSLITSATSLGALAGGLSAGVLADSHGRKRVIFFADVLFFLGALLQAFAFTVTPLLIGRLIVGIGVGLGSLVVPLYISELAPPEIRGRLVVISVLFITFGQLLAYIVGIILSPPSLGADLSWRAILGLGAIPALLQSAAMGGMPESPRWLLSRRKKAAARECISRIYGTKRGGVIDAVLANIQNGLDHSDSELKGLAGVRTLWSSFADRRALVISALLQLWQQACGFNCLMYFSATLFSRFGFADPLLVALIVAGTNAAVTSITLPLIDRLGRRKLLLFSLAGMTVGLLLLAGSIHFLPPPPTPLPVYPTAGVLVGIGLFVASYAVGLGNVPWISQSEMFSMSARGVGTGVATGVNWATNLAVNLVFLEMVERGATGVFAGFAGVTLVGGVLAWWGFPEMRGVVMEDVGEVLAQGWRVR